MRWVSTPVKTKSHRFADLYEKKQPIIFNVLSFSFRPGLIPSFLGSLTQHGKKWISSEGKHTGKLSVHTHGDTFSYMRHVHVHTHVYIQVPLKTVAGSFKCVITKDCSFIQRWVYLSAQRQLSEEQKMCRLPRNMPHKQLLGDFNLPHKYFCHRGYRGSDRMSKQNMQQWQERHSRDCPQGPSTHSICNAVVLLCGLHVSGPFVFISLFFCPSLAVSTASS